MKKTILLSLLIVLPYFLNAQFDNIGKKIEKKVNRRIEQRIDQSIDKGINSTENTIEDAVTDGVSQPKKKKSEQRESSLLEQISNEPQKEQAKNSSPAAEEKSTPGTGFNYSTKFDFVPGNTILFLDNFEDEYVGDFPSKWNTNGSGEIVKVKDTDDKWLKLRSSSIYIPDLPHELSDNFTIEFDVVTSGLTNKTSSTSMLTVILDDNNLFAAGKTSGIVGISPCQYIAVDMQVESKNKGETIIKNSLQADIRKNVLQKTHFSIAVNNQRYRMWVNEKKYIDIPRFLPENTNWFLKLGVKDLKEENGESIFIGNIKVANGGEDLRKKLETEGQISTNGILFHVNSAEVKPESYGIFKNIAQVLDNNPEMKIKIIGHTDSDGLEISNLDLSMQRADAVRDILVNEFNIDKKRLETEGKGESSPAVPNDTPIHKAENRRVDFVRL